MWYLKGNISQTKPLTFLPWENSYLKQVNSSMLTRTSTDISDFLQVGLATAICATITRNVLLSILNCNEFWILICLFSSFIGLYQKQGLFIIHLWIPRAQHCTADSHHLLPSQVSWSPSKRKLHNLYNLYKESLVQRIHVIFQLLNCV